MRTKFCIYESRTDYTYREPERGAEERWVLFPSVRGSADRTAVSEKMDGHPGKESGEGAVYREIRKKPHKT